MSDIHIIRLGFVSCYLLKGTKGYVLIDAGIPSSGKKILKYLQKNNIDPAEINLIIITHGHNDHVGSLKQLKEVTGAQIAIHETEAPLLEQGISPQVNPQIRMLKWFYKPDKEVKVTAVKPDILVTDNHSLEEYGIDGKIIHTPGHTDGSITVIYKEKHAFIGDIAMKLPLLSFSYKPIIAQNMGQVYESWRKIISEGGETFYPSHGKIFDKTKLMEILNKNR